MRKGDIVKLAGDPEGRYLLLEAPGQELVSVEVICELPTKPNRILKVADLEVDKKLMAFREARQVAYGSPCDGCGKVEQFPGKGLGLYEAPYSEAKWLCESCFPGEYEEDED
jgi:hypothetical protein